MEINNNKTAYQKGSELEEAVKLLEQTILKSKPGLKDAPFLIESKKIIVKNGVRNEIDVYVEIDLGHGYKSVFIFECKNWKDPVGKNDIIIFSEKIKLTNSQKGYFVAEKFTKDARNQAITDERIELLELTINEAKKRGFSYISGSRNPENVRAIKLHNYFGFKKVFRVHYHPKFTRDIIILELRFRGKVIGKILGFFNTRVGNLLLSISLRVGKSLFPLFLTYVPDEYPDVDILHMIRTFEKINTIYD